MKVNIQSIFAIAALFLVSGRNAYSQDSDRMIVGVAKFTSEVNSPFVDAVSEKVVQIVSNTRRFTVVDRTSYDKVKEELEFQKTEAFIDSENTVQQGKAMAAEFMIIGHLIKMNIYSMKNPDGSINGYKASAAFTLKVNNVETGETTEAAYFQTSVSPQAMSKEQAVNQALQSVEEPINDYFVKTFPLTAKILRIFGTKKNAATDILINVGKHHGIKVGDKFMVEHIEMLDGKPYHSAIGEITVAALSGNDFAECSVNKKIGEELLARFQAAEQLSCSLIIK